MNRTPLRRVSKKKAKEIRDSRPVVAAVLERDGGCVLRCHEDVAGKCFGVLTPHHIRKQSKRAGDWRPQVLVCACAHHNGTWIEGNRDKARSLGLVVTDGDSLRFAWSLMRFAGLAVGAQQVLCEGSGRWVHSGDDIALGRSGCLVCHQTVALDDDDSLSEHMEEW